MAQHDYDIANQTFPSFRSDLNNVLSAINTSNSGTSRPSGAVEGTIWLDTTSASTPTLKFYDGSDDISLATLNYTSNTVNWLDSTVIFDIVNDTTPQLGGNLDVNGNSLVSTSNGNITFTPNGTGKVIISGLSHPTSDGSANQFLQTDGAGNLSFATAGLSWQSSIKTSNFTAVAGEGYWINTTSNAVTMTLPASASVGDTIEFVDYARNWATNKVTVNQNSLNFQGFSTPNPEYNTNGQSVRIVYSGSTKGWIPTSDDDVTDEVPQPIVMDFLVIAGGGGGGFASNTGQRGGGGGGAGGYRNSYSTESSGGGGSSETSLTLTESAVYTVTVGAGGSGNADGSDSSVSGTGITTITSAGGGRGGVGDFHGGNDGGSGGGGSHQGGAGSGTANQGFDGGSPAIDDNPPYLGTGGGGAGSVGSGATGSPNYAAGNGGSGLSSSITGSSVGRAGGGGGNGTGGGTNYNTTATDGGGAGSGGGTGTAGTTNTGGGGGAGNTSGANGGSGVVILRLPTSQYTGTTTGSPTVTTDGTDTIMTFTGSGSYTA